MKDMRAWRPARKPRPRATGPDKVAVKKVHRNHASTCRSAVRHAAAGEVIFRVSNRFRCEECADLMHPAISHNIYQIASK